MNGIGPGIFWLAVSLVCEIFALFKVKLGFSNRCLGLAAALFSLVAGLSADYFRKHWVVSDIIFYGEILALPVMRVVYGRLSGKYQRR
jgi:hypothetical protein